MSDEVMSDETSAVQVLVPATSYNTVQPFSNTEVHYTPAYCMIERYGEAAECLHTTNY